MKTFQVVGALEFDPITRKKFCGVFSSNQLLEVLEGYLCGFVANSDPEDRPELHWVTFYFSSEHQGEFFDSYGKPKNYYQETFRNYLER